MASAHDTAAPRRSLPFKRVVAKVGTNMLTAGTDRLDLAVMANLVSQIARIKAQGCQVVLVSSGAVAAGKARLRQSAPQDELPTRQVWAAIGQSLLMEAYDQLFRWHDITLAQALLTRSDLQNRLSYLNARNTFLGLLNLGVVPIVNENDAIANNEIRYGDNDHMSALLSHLVSADMLVLLTDTDGLYTDDPRTNPAARRVDVVHADDPLLSVNATAHGSNRGSGGMASKLASARIASWSGVTAVIAPATHDGAVLAAVNGDTGTGTRFEPHDRQLSARKLWIAFASEVEGAVTVDDGARATIVDRGTSLLPAGVVGVTGTFDEGATIEVVASDGSVIARGMSLMTAGQVGASMGKRSADLNEGAPTVLVHRDDLVVLV